MNIKKLFTAVVIAVLFSAGLFYAFPAIAPTEEIAGVFSNYFSLPSCSIIGVAFATVYLLFAFRKKAIADGDIPMKEYDWLYQHAGDEAKAQMAALSDEDKLRYVATMKGILSQDKKNALSNYVHELKTPKRPAAMKAASWLALIAVTAYVGQQGYEAYTAVQPMMEAYLAQQNATYEDQILYIDGLPPIQLIGDGKLKQIDVNKKIETIKLLPSSVLTSHSKFIIYSHDNFEVAKKNAMNIPDYADGFASSDLITHLSIDCRESIISHESSHVFDFKNGPYWASNSSEFQNLWQTYRGSFKFPGVDNEYCNSTSKEFFAESGKLYIDNPEYLEKNCKALYDYFSKLYES